jgi:hypothetical protein
LLVKNSGANSRKSRGVFAKVPFVFFPTAASTSLSAAVAVDLDPAEILAAAEFLLGIRSPR